MIYFDSCYIAKLYLPEADSAAVRAAARVGGMVACSEHGMVEVVSVFHRKLRENQLSQSDFKLLCAQFEAEASTGLYRWLKLNSQSIRKAVGQIQLLSSQIFLRAADALHLIVASENGFKTVYSSDKHLLNASSHFGIQGITA